jgi:hypothetical protein
MKSNTYFKIWDTVEKSYVAYPTSAQGPSLFSSLDEAEEFIDWLLDRGNYPDRPSSVFQAHKFLNGKLIAA